ncbi:hypothetical protein ANASTE_00888 [Anaerofustis stercorihominis DSM 17244]|uniref:Uncharacterized protein n=1 Tax=Anaerofustis stercorihominis DSM 17244 TaxID=445971 RepID=B1C831_9FIRM|nr:hypothetical protein ANASTE_00888 [Anaerofustis stercorihominis DSM 17244]
MIVNILYKSERFLYLYIVFIKIILLIFIKSFFVYCSDYTLGVRYKYNNINLLLYSIED